MLSRFLAAFALLLTPVVSHAQEAGGENRALLEQGAADVVAVMGGEKEAEDVFADNFLAQVSPAMLAQVNAQLTTQFGAVQGLESVVPTGPLAATISIRFEKAIGSGPMQLSGTAPNKVVGLLLNDFKPLDDSIDKLEADISALPGKISVLYAPLNSGEPYFVRDPSGEYAIGSTFKLYILSALARSIEADERSWSDVVTLDRKSFPSGRLQNWPDGAPLTIQTLATLMISISDNTATDVLLHAVGRDAVEAELRASGHSDPARTLPFLSTLELFALKGSEPNMQKYISADEAGRRFILADFEDDVRGDPTQVAPPRFEKPTAIDTLEWFASGEDLRKLLARIVALEDPTARKIMAINPSLSEPMRAKWAYAGFKGGSEPGVLNLTWLLQDKAGEWHLLAMSWNDDQAEVDSSTFELLAQRILSLPRN